MRRRGVAGTGSKIASHGHGGVSGRPKHHRRPGAAQVARKNKTDRRTAAGGHRIDDRSFDLRNRYGIECKVAADRNLGGVDACAHRGWLFTTDCIRAKESIDYAVKQIGRLPANAVEGQHLSLIHI